MQPLQLACRLALIVSISAPAKSQFTTFFGEDLGLGEAAPLPASPLSDAARISFLANLGGVGTEDFEALGPGTAAPLPISFGVAGTATLLGTGVVMNVMPGTTNGVGRYATSGAQFWEASSVFSVEFDMPQAAFGFYGVDIGDFGGQVTLTLGLTGGGSEILVIPNTINGAGGGILYFGLIADDPTNTFESVSFGNTAPGVDFFAFDDLTIGTLEQLNLGTPFCSNASNSTGLPGLISAVGSADVVDNDLTLIASNLPAGQTGYFIASPNAGFVANPAGSQGNLCIASPHARYNSLAGVPTNGQFSIVVDLQTIPLSTSGPTAVLPGDSWVFQFWHRDNNPGMTSNFTNAIEITFN